jgi:hypothetical protein
LCKTKEMLTRQVIFHYGPVDNKGKNKIFYSAIRLYIADNFIRLYLFILRQVKDDITKTMMKRLNNLKSINQLSSI